MQGRSDVRVASGCLGRVVKSTRVSANPGVRLLAGRSDRRRPRRGCGPSLQPRRHERGYLRTVAQGVATGGRFFVLGPPTTRMAPSLKRERFGKRAIAPDFGSLKPGKAILSSRWRFKE